MRVILVALVLFGVLMAVAVGRAQWWPFGGGAREEIAELRVEVAELELTERRLREENSALAATNRTLRTELDRLRDSEVEIERLRGELARALSDLEGSRARTEEVRGQLSTSLADNARLEERLRAAPVHLSPGPESSPRGSPWVVISIVAIVAVLVWRELWWRSRWVVGEPPRVVDGPARGLAHQGRAAPATRARSSEHSRSRRV